MLELEDCLRFLSKTYGHSYTNTLAHILYQPLFPSMALLLNSTTPFQVNLSLFFLLAFAPAISPRHIPFPTLKKILLPSSIHLTSLKMTSWNSSLPPGLQHHPTQLTSNYMLLLLSRFSRVQLLATPWTAVYQAPPSMGFSRQEYWSGVPLPCPNYMLPYGISYAVILLLYRYLCIKILYVQFD